MSTDVSKCPIWGDDCSVQGYYAPQNRTYYVDDSPRAAGGYILPEATKHGQVDNLSLEQKARLTSWLVSQRKQGNLQPKITEQTVHYALNRPPLSAYDRAVGLLALVAKSATVVGEEVDVSNETHEAFALSESTTWNEIEFLVRFLEEAGWVRAQHGVSALVTCTVTVAGYSHIAEQAANFNSSQAFIAMWFGESMDDAFEHGIRPAVQDAGYEALRIDRKEHINKIDDEIIAEVRRSRFLVADFTHGEDGARGGVYYEAGFAHGLNLPVIFTCREDFVDKLHFDTNHYNHVVWTEPLDLREKLKNRILAAIGEGPRAHQAP